MKLCTRGLLATLLLGGLACAAVTKIPMQWRNAEYQGGPFRKVFVIGIAETELGRRSFEDHFAAALTRGETHASPSYIRLPETDRLSEAGIRSAMDDDGFDAVIITRLLAVDEDTRYIPPRTYTVPRSYYGYYGYYNTSWELVHEPGYTKTTTIVRLETNLYAVRGATLVWSGQSETFDPRDTSDAIASVTAAVAKDLAGQGLVGSPQK